MKSLLRVAMNSMHYVLEHAVKFGVILSTDEQGSKSTHALYGALSGAERRRSA